MADSQKLIPVTEWSKYHPWPSIAGLRYLIFHAETNGFINCLRRVGRRVLINEAEFFVWIEQSNGKTIRGGK